MRKPRLVEVNLNELDPDIGFPLRDWKKLIDDLIHLNGENTIMQTNAGYNHVALYLLRQPGTSKKAPPGE